MMSEHAVNNDDWDGFVFIFDDGYLPFSNYPHVQNHLKYLLSRSRQHHENEATPLNYLRIGFDAIGGLGKIHDTSVSDLSSILPPGYAKIIMSLSYPLYAARTKGGIYVSNVVERDADGSVSLIARMVGVIAQRVPEDVVEPLLERLAVAIEDERVIPLAEADLEQRLFVESLIDDFSRRSIPSYLHVSHHDQAGDHHIHRILRQEDVQRREQENDPDDLTVQTIEYSQRSHTAAVREDEVVDGRLLENDTEHFREDYRERVEMMRRKRCYDEWLDDALPATRSGLWTMIAKHDLYLPAPDYLIWPDPLMNLAAHDRSRNIAAGIMSKYPLRFLSDIAREAMPDGFPVVAWFDDRIDIPFILTGYNAETGQITGFPTIHLNPRGCFIETQGWTLRRTLPAGWRNGLPVSERLRQWRSCPADPAYLAKAVSVFDTVIRPILADSFIGVTEVAARLDVPMLRLVQWLRDNEYLTHAGGKKWLPGKAAPSGMTRVEMTDRPYSRPSVLWSQDIVTLLQPHAEEIRSWHSRDKPDEDQAPKKKSWKWWQKIPKRSDQRPASSQQKGYITYLCRSQKRAVPNMSGMTAKQASDFIDQMDKDGKSGVDTSTSLVSSKSLLRRGSKVE